MFKQYCLIPLHKRSIYIIERLFCSIRGGIFYLSQSCNYDTDLIFLIPVAGKPVFNDRFNQVQ